MALAFTHLVADFFGVPDTQLRDAALIGGLLVAAVGAAGLAVRGVPVMRPSCGDGVSGVFLLESGYVMVLTVPAAELLLLDVLAPATQEPRKVLDVFARRLVSREIRTDERARG